MQSPGLGNPANALGSLAIPYELAAPLLISTRGTRGERNPAQVAMAQSTVPLLTALGVQVFSMRSDTEGNSVVRGAVTLSFKGSCPVAILLDPELGGGRDERR